MRPALSSVPVVAALAAFLAAPFGCGPSINPAVKADIDNRAAALKPSGQTIPAPTGFTPMPLAAGQWTQFKLVDDKGEPSFMTQKILGIEGDATRVEVVTESYRGKQVMNMLAALGDRTDPAAVQIRALKMKDPEGRVTELDPAMLQMMQGLYKNALSTLIINWQGLPQEDAEVPAGKFAGCFKARTDAAWGPWKSSSLTWSHAAVPISGLVKSEGLDKPTRMELVAYGESGARSEI